MKTRLGFFGLIFTALLFVFVQLAQAQGGLTRVTDPNSAIVGSWISPDGNGIVTFLSNGTYFLADKSPDDPTDPCGHKGMEQGTYTWDASTGAFNVQTTADTNGCWGLSDSSASKGWYLAMVSGDYLTLTSNTEGASPLLSRVTDSNSAIVGGWYGSGSDGQFVITFTSNGTYFHAQSGPINDSGGWTGVEEGTYTWNASTGAFTFKTLLDTNGSWGFSSTPSDAVITVTVSGNTLASTETGGAVGTTPVYANQIPLYDDFSSGTVDATKWVQDVPVGTVSVVNNALQIVSNVTGSVDVKTRVRFTSPGNFSAMSADVTVTNYQVSSGTHFARLTGAFYNDGTAGSAPGSQVGDIWAGLFVTDNAISYGVFRCLDSTCLTSQYLTGDGTTNHVYLAGSALGQPHTLFVQWDGSIFTFQVDNNSPAFYDPKTKAPIVSSTPNKPVKWIGIRHLETAGQSGSMTATFDNVRAGTAINATSLASTNVWKHSQMGTIFSNESRPAETTYFTVVTAQTGTGFSGTIGYQDTLGRSGSTVLNNGSVNGNAIAAQMIDFDPACASRTITGTGTLGLSTMTLSLSAPMGGSCPAYSNVIQAYTLATPITYTASGTYSYVSSSQTITVTWTSSNWKGDGPRAGGPPEQLRGVSVTDTTTNVFDVPWTRPGGTAGDITGTWARIDPVSGNILQTMFNSDGTFTLIGKFASGASGSASGWSDHSVSGYSGNPVYYDPTHNGTSVTVTGPNIPGAMSLTFNTDRGEWDAFLPPSSSVNYGSTHPSAPLTYNFVISTATGTLYDTGTIGCFIDQLPTNISAVRNADGTSVINWTKLPSPYSNMRYNIHIQHDPNPSLPGTWLWENEQVDVSSMLYTGPTLTPGNYTYMLSVHPGGSLDCETLSWGSFTLADSTSENLTGHVYTGTGAGVCGAQISLSGTSGSAYTTTGSDGSYVVSVPTGTYWMNVNYNPSMATAYGCNSSITYPAYSFPGTQFSVTGNMVKNFSLPQIYTVSGKVVDQNGTGLTNVSVSFNSSMSSYATTTSDGSYSVSVYAGTYNVGLSKGNTSLTAMTGLTVSSNMSQNFTWGAGYTLSGVVTSGTGTGVCGAQISLSGTSGSAYTTTGSDGSYVVSVPTGTYWMNVNYNPSMATAYGCNSSMTYPAYSFPGTQFSVTGNMVKNFSLPQIYTVSGKVVDQNGTGLTNVSVSFNSSMSSYATTTSDGSYSVSVYAGTYNVGLSKGNTSLTAMTGLTVSSNMSQNFTWGAGYTLSGVVTSGTGTGVCGAQISLSGTSGSAYTTTGSDGSYVVSVPTGTYWMNVNYNPSMATAYGCNSSMTYPAYSFPGTQFSVTGNMVKNFSLPQIYTVSGKVVDQNGTGLTNVSVSFNSSMSSYATTTSDGSYSVRVYAGTYNVGLSSGSTNFTAMTGLTVSSNMIQNFTWGVTIVQKGNITGTVTGASGGISGVKVLVYDGTGAIVSGATATTEANGNYTVSGLLAGNYKVCFDGSAADYSSQCINYVTVNAGQTTPNINAMLVQVGIISGRVTADAVGVPGVQVTVYSQNGVMPGMYMSAGSAQSDQNGDYSVGVVTSGAYKVCFDGSGAGYLYQCFNNKKDIVSADTVTATVAQTTSNIDATLKMGGSIVGRVTGDGSVGISNVSVTVYDGTTNYSIRSTQTTSTGDYSITALPSGSYKIQYDATSSNSGYLGQWYDNKTDITSANTVTVTAPAITTVDVQLVLGGSITGKVTNGTTGLLGVQVMLYDQNGMPVWGAAAMQVHTTTDQTGGYTIGGLASQAYKVCYDGRGLGYLFQCYSNKNDIVSANTITVTVSQATPNVDAALVLGGSITGMVTNGSTGINNVSVSLYNGVNGTLMQWVYTSPTGSYTLSALTTGDYKVCFDGGSAGYTKKCFNSKSFNPFDLSTADVVHVNVSQTTAGIDSVLSLAGSISGNVAVINPMMNMINVIAYDALDSNLQFGWVTTDLMTGNYTINGLPAGNYKVLFHSAGIGYTDQWYNNKADFSSADVVSVATLTTHSGINATMVQGYIVTTSAGPGGTISPVGPVSVVSGGTYTFTILPYQGYKMGSVTGCGGSLNGNTFVTGPVTGPCTISASFVALIAPTINFWPTAGAINYGQTLATSSLTSGSASVAGSFAFTAPATMPNAGTFFASVTFTPSDTVNYSTVIGSVSVTVNKATPIVNAWPTASSIAFGQKLSDSTLIGGSASVPGRFAFTMPATAPGVGMAAQSVTFTPTDTMNYNNVVGSVNVTVANAAPTVNTWPTASSITYGQLLSASTLTGGSSSVSGSFAFTTPATTPNAGTASQGVTFTPTDTTNYSTVIGSVNVTVNKATLTVTANNASKTYGSANPAFTVSYSGFQGSDTAASLTAQPTAVTAAITSSPTGTYAITASGGVSGNYTFNYVNGTLTISKTALTVTANNASKTYGSANPAFTVSYSGFQGSDAAASLTAQPTAVTAAITSSPTGTYAITAGGGVSGNYTFNYVNGTLTISKAALTVTANNASKTYGSANPAFTVSYSGFQGSDIAASLTAQPTAVTAAITSSPTGTYAITAGGGVSGNYTFNYVNGTLTISKAALTVTANNASKTYGSANPAFTVSYSGFQGSDTAASLTAQPTAVTAAITSSPTGTYAITAGGGVSGNYTFNYVNGTLTISKAALTVTANNASKTYGSANPAFTVSYSGFQGSDTAASLTAQPTAVTAAITSSPTGTYAITASGGVSGNYTFNYVNGTLTVNAAALTITASNRTKTYGQAVTFAGTEFTTSGLASGDTVASVTLTSAGTGTGAGASTYSITPSAAVFGNGAIGNYTITYANGTLMVNKATLTVTANPQSKTYGDVDPSLTYTYSGLVSGNTASVFTGGLTRAAVSNAGTYAITQGTLSAGGNYTISYTGANLTINKRSLTVTAATNTKTYDGTMAAAATPAITAGAPQGTDTASFTESYAAKNVGSNLALTPSGIVNDGNGGNNYSYTFVNNTTGAITARLLTVTATGVSKTYDGTNAATVTLMDNRVTGDVFTSETYTGAIFSDMNVGTDKTVTVTGISISGVAAANYLLSNMTATTTANITTKSLTVTGITASDKTYDGTTTATLSTSGATLSGVIGSDSVTLNLGSATGTFSDANAGTGKTVAVSGLTISGTGSGNYSLTQPTTTAGIFSLGDGDLDGGGVSVSDALRALNIVVGYIVPTVTDWLHADVAPLVNGKPQPDGKLDIGDVVVILRRSVGLVIW